MRGSINLARDLGLSTVAEGIEDWHTLRAVAKLGCEEMQGNLINIAATTSRLGSMGDRLGSGMAGRTVDGPMFGVGPATPADRRVGTRSSVNPLQPPR